ncbi:MAG: hypothetical protein DRP93_06205 [Candidatus Neomarinimicrobiota bacterium]|nr:MAG: hypothetical protein DRP93_06205 [Candidatus Neomarinimicrobiota bacterium]
MTFFPFYTLRAAPTWLLILMIFLFYKAFAPMELPNSPLRLYTLHLSPKASGAHLLGDKNIKMTAKETQHAASLQFPLGEEAQKAPLFA